MLKNKLDRKKKKHYFFLNPYSDCAFTKCPKCENTTKIRKFPLVIHIAPQQMLVLNKGCKYCTSCDLIIAKKQEIENSIALGFSQENTQIFDNDYLVIGTVARKDWQLGNRGLLTSQDIIDRMDIFIDHRDFEVIPAGWYQT
jgi:hypothetical protein